MSYFARSDELPAWVAGLPDSWGSDWLKWSVRLSTDRPSEEEQAGLPYISNEDIASWTGKLLNDEPKPAESEGRKFQIDDVLLNKLRPYLAKVYHADFDGVSSGELLCLRPSDTVMPRFLFYVLSSKGFIDSIDAETFGSKMPRADWEIVGHQPLPLPPLEIQRRIAQFLDEKTARIDSLIEKKRSLLDRLAEKRQALISRAVTKGLNPDVLMKPSGIDWLGDIPAHWEVIPLKRAVRYQEGPGIMAVDFRDDGVPLLRVSSVGGRYATLSGVNYLDPEKVELKWRHFLTELGDLLISASATSGIVSEVTEATVGCVPYTGIIRINPIEGISTSSFIRHLLVSDVFLSQIDQLKAGSTIQHFGPYHLGLMVIGCPPIHEQFRIGDELDEKLDKLDANAEKIERSVEILLEYRAALITAAVTGKIKGLE
ncbi:restriction endonuclease subunit S [Marinobacter salsuginis]|uniref:restriction endonuclease subunit S n=1 Tax=Marinobacter salsuginis TaxID=418719 RepID=UPI001ADF50FC|nr:restriction endonuclease subunit S [Marinobacter salsuginis]QTN40895.1 restriction endonuclease subunit S [Marinobacter salsuginis]